jgi:hypothetical protein
MSLNIINLTGIVSKPRYIPANQPGPNGKSMNFPRFSALIGISDSYIDINGQRHPLASQDFWVDINCPVSGGAVDERRINALIDKINHGYVYVMIVNGTFSQWNSNAGPKYSIKVSFGDFFVADKPFMPTNKAIVSGQATKQETNALYVEERYRVKEEWKSRTIPVYLSAPVSPVQGRQTLVYGRLATRDHQGNRSLYIIAEEVY